MRLDKYLCLGQLLARNLIPMCRVEINLQYPTSWFPKLDKSQMPGPAHREISGYTAQHGPWRTHFESLRNTTTHASRNLRYRRTVRRAWATSTPERARLRNGRV